MATQPNMKDVVAVYPPPPQHWVGDGFPVRSLLSYTRHGAHASPFLLLDHAGPMHFEPAERPRGVGEHPHRGFETVTIVYEGEVSHRDSTGAGGTIGPGDVQWMTAAAGILHDEFHSPAFTRTGGSLEMAQLWVNLPAKDKMSAPKYQNIKAQAIPVVPLTDEAGTVRVIAGNYNGVSGAASTFTELDVWDVRVNANKSAHFNFPAGRTLSVVVLKGAVTANGETITSGELAILDTHGETLSVKATEDSKLLLLSGEPIDEPIVGHGPFVMNSKAEIQQAFQDFSSGRFGRIE